MSTVDLQEAKIRIERALHPLRQRSIFVGFVLAIAIAVLVTLGTLLTGMWLDLTVPLPVTIRRLFLPLAMLSAVSFAIALLRRQSKSSSDPKLARRVDDVSGAGGSVMTGYELANESEKNSGPLSEGLALMAAQQAEDVCLKVDEVQAVPSDSARYWWKVVGATSFVLALLACIVPRMAWTQVQRILVPTESQIPYSPTSITVQPGDTEVLFGSDLELIAQVDGPRVDDLALVLENQQGRTERLPMLAETDVTWRTFLTRVTQPARYHVEAGTTRSPSYELKVKLTPQITSAECKIQSPTYTARGAYEGPLPQNGITGIAGTTVTLRIKSNRPLQSGRVVLLLDDQESVAELQRDTTDPNSVVGEFQLTRSGQFSISIVDQDQIPSADTIDGVIKVVPDHAPVIRLLQPRPVSMATPDVDLPIVVAAEDDFGIQRIEVFRGLNGSPPMGDELKLPEPSASHQVGTKLPLATYGLQPGDEITLFARAEDNDPAGAKGAESPIATVRIISREQLAKIEMSKKGLDALLNKQRQVQRTLQALKEKMQQAKDAQDRAAAASDTEPKEAQEASQAAKDAMNQASQAMQQAAQQMQQLAEHQLPVDMDQEMSERLKEMADKLEQAARRLSELNDKVQSGQSLSGEEKQELNELMQQLGDQKQQHQEQSMTPMEKFSKAFPLKADEQRFQQLARRQRNLAQRMDALRPEDPTDPATRRRADELRREQQQLQVALSQLAEDIQSHANELPDDPEFDKLRESAEEFARNLRACEADPKMTAAQQGLLNDDPAAASQDAAEAADILESFLSQCQGMGDQACKNCESSFNPGSSAGNIGNSIDQLLKSMGLGDGQTGMKPGMGAGMAPGGGYSMPQNTADNIGLYGGLPMQMDSPRSGNGDKADGGIAVYEQGGSANAIGSSIQAEEATARGDSGAGIPSLYREQVSEYFRQLADELGDL